MTATAFVPLPPAAPGNVAPAGSNSPSPIGPAVPGVEEGSVSVLGGFEAVLARLQSAQTDAAAGQTNGKDASLGGNVVSIAPLRGIEDVPPQILFPANGITLEVLDGQAAEATPLLQAVGAADISETGEQPLFAVDERGQLLISAQLLAAVLARLDADGLNAKQVPADSAAVLATDATVETGKPILDPNSITIPISVPPDALTEIPVTVSTEQTTGQSVLIPVSVPPETLTEIPIAISGDVSTPISIPVAASTEQPVLVPIAAPSTAPTEIPIAVSGDVSSTIPVTASAEGLVEIPITNTSETPANQAVAVSSETVANVPLENAPAPEGGEYVAVSLPGAPLAATSAGPPMDDGQPATASTEQGTAQKPVRTPGQPETQNNPTARDGLTAAARQVTTEAEGTEKTPAGATKRDPASTDAPPTAPKAATSSVANAAAVSTRAVEGKAQDEVYLRVPPEELPESLRKQDAKLVLHVSRTPAASANTAPANPAAASATSSGTQVSVNGQTVSVEVLAENSETSSGRGQSQNQDRPRQDAQAQDLRAYLQGDAAKADSAKGSLTELSQAERDFVKETHRDKSGLPPRAAEKTASERSAAELPAAKPDTEGQTARQTVDTSRNMTNGSDRMTSATSTASTASTAGGTTMKETIARYEQISQQIVRGVSAQIGESRSHVTIRLTPEHLGQVDVRLVLDEGVLSARLWASEPETRALLERNASQLRATLEESGIRVDRVAVSKETAERGGYQREQANQERQADQERRQARREGEGDPNESQRRQNPNPAPFSFADTTADESPA